MQHCVLVMRACCQVYGILTYRDSSRDVIALKFVILVVTAPAQNEFYQYILTNMASVKSLSIDVA